MSSIPISSPHAHDHSSIRRIMTHVCFALLPCTLFGFSIFGLAALNVFILTVMSCLFFEWACLKLMKKPTDQILDGSSVLTGWLLAISLPPWAPWWICVSGAFVAIVIGKQLYGGIGQNVFNPAMLARVALLISFPVQLTTWPVPLDTFFDQGLMESLAITFELKTIPDGLTGATPLGALKTALSAQDSAADLINQTMEMKQSLMGFSGGSLGETSAILILFGGIWLLAMRVITWPIPFAMIGTVVLLTGFFHWLDPNRYADVSFHLLTGSLLLGAFFFATDYVTSPSSKIGQLVFGCGCGALEFVIRTWGGYPEGISFAVLFMNALTPLIDMIFRPRIYGRKLDGTPKQYPSSVSISND